MTRTERMKIETKFAQLAKQLKMTEEQKRAIIDSNDGDIKEALATLKALKKFIQNA